MQLASNVAESHDDFARIWTFMKALESSHLLDRATIEELRSAHAGGHFESLQIDLMERKLLTPYQVRRIADGNRTCRPAVDVDPGGSVLRHIGQFVQ